MPNQISLGQRGLSWTICFSSARLSFTFPLANWIRALASRSNALIDAADSSRVYAATETGVYKSVNAGLTFSPSSMGLPSGVPVNDIARMTDVPSYLYVGLRGQGVYESDDFAATWHAFGPALPGDNDVRAILATFEPDTAHVFVGTRADGLFEAQIDATTQNRPTTWGRLKDRFR